MNGECRLCLQEAELRNSHVIPEFVYTALGVYDEKHRFCAFSTDPNVRVDTHQKGLREKLLCDTCEGRLNVWETYAKKVLFGGVALDVEGDEQLGAIAHGVDYEKFKLFAMSLLWRASVSTLETFENVTLGPHEDKLRRLLLVGDAGERWRYGCGILFSSRPVLEMMASSRSQGLSTARTPSVSRRTECIASCSARCSGSSPSAA